MILVELHSDKVINYYSCPGRPNDFVESVTGQGVLRTGFMLQDCGILAKFFSILGLSFVCPIGHRAVGHTPFSWLSVTLNKCESDF